MLRFADFCADRQQMTDNRQQTTDKPTALPPAAHARTRGNKNYYGISMQGDRADGVCDCLQLYSCSQCLCSHGGKYAF